MRPATAEELAAKQGLDLPRPLRMVAPPETRSQAAYIGYFDDAIAVMQTAEALERTAYELAPTRPPRTSTTWRCAGLRACTRAMA